MSHSSWQILQVGRPRSLHVSATIGDFMYVFGGYDGTSRLNDLHRFDFGSSVWTHVAPVGGVAPPPRDRSAAVSLLDSLYIFGGFDGANRTNDLWRFDTLRSVWVDESSVVGAVPSCRHSHSAVVYDSKIYICFGYDGNYRSDIYCFDIGSHKWTPIVARGQIPSPRYRSSAVVFGDKMFIFGGHDGTRHLADLVCFDFLLNCWTNIDTSVFPLGVYTPTVHTPPLQAGGPPGRDSHTATIHERSMFVFGGSSGAARNDLWEYRFDKSCWMLLDESGPFRFCHVAAIHKNAFYVHAGYDGQHRLSDFLSFHIPDNWMLDLPEPTILNDLKQLVNDPGFADVCFLLQGTPNDTHVHGTRNDAPALPRTPNHVKFFAHRVLMGRCAYFKALFANGMLERDQLTISLPNVDIYVFGILVEFIYTDQAVVSPAEAFPVLEAADRFGIDRLRTICEQAILASITPENACEILQTADTHNATILKQKSTEFIIRNYETVVKTGGFESLARTNIELVLDLIRKRVN